MSFGKPCHACLGSRCSRHLPAACVIHLLRVLRATQCELPVAGAQLCTGQQTVALNQVLMLAVVRGMQLFARVAAGGRQPRRCGIGWKVLLGTGWLNVSSDSCHHQTVGMGYAGRLREDGRSRRLLAMSSYHVEANRLVGTAHIWRQCSCLLFLRPSPTSHHLHKPGFCIVAFPESGGSTVFYWWILFDFSRYK